MYKRESELSSEFNTRIITTEVNIDSQEIYDMCLEGAERSEQERFLKLVSTYFDNNNNVAITFECQHGHKMFSIFHLLDEGSIMKIGQYPHRSIFDDNLKKYRKVIDKDYMRELKKACGLINHGIGIGLYTYLRRLFEKSIFEIYNKYFETDIEDKKVLSEFTNLKMDEKLKVLRDFLPEFMKDNKSLYGVLSKGIHELDEDMCLANFEVLLKCIICILEDRLEKKSKDNERTEIKKKIDKISMELKQINKIVI